METRESRLWWKKNAQEGVIQIGGRLDAPINVQAGFAGTKPGLGKGKGGPPRQGGRTHFSLSRIAKVDLSLQ